MVDPSRKIDHAAKLALVGAKISMHIRHVFVPSSASPSKTQWRGKAKLRELAKSLGIEKTMERRIV